MAHKGTIKTCIIFKRQRMQGEKNPTCSCSHGVNNGVIWFYKEIKIILFVCVQVFFSSVKCRRLQTCLCVLADRYSIIPEGINILKKIMQPMHTAVVQT